MADANILAKVKKGLGITGDYQDATITVYIDEVVAYMVSAGVPTSLITADVSAGVITRGVADLWNYNGGAGNFSEYFYQRVTQLTYTPEVNE